MTNQKGFLLSNVFSAINFGPSWKTTFIPIRPVFVNTLLVLCPCVFAPVPCGRPIRACVVCVRMSMCVLARAGACARARAVCGCFFVPEGPLPPSIFGRAARSGATAPRRLARPAPTDIIHAAIMQPQWAPRPSSAHPDTVERRATAPARYSCGSRGTNLLAATCPSWRHLSADRKSVV